MAESYDGGNSDSNRRISNAAASRYAATIANRAMSPAPPNFTTTGRSPSRTPPVLSSREVVVRGPPSLEQIRQGPRSQNEYVDAPHIQQKCGNNNTVQNNLIPVTEQPISSGLKKEPPGPPTTTTEDTSHTDSIICPKCHKCKCNSCTQPRELPEKWLCKGIVHCSADEVVELCTCLCCVKCIFYHLFKDCEQDDEMWSADEPCACCNRPHCCQRWGCLGLMSLCLPCLCCYLPSKCLVGMLTACYNCCHRQGCRCRRDRKPSGTKRLLLESESSSS